MSDRHEKWTPVEPGTVIPAGQPYAVNRIRETGGSLRWAEYVYESEVVVPPASSTSFEFLVDSTWKPPLVLPTEPTWGIVVHKSPEFQPRMYGCYALTEINGELWFAGCYKEDVLDFIPLTDEQVARIEAAR